MRVHHTLKGQAIALPSIAGSMLAAKFVWLGEGGPMLPWAVFWILAAACTWPIIRMDRRGVFDTHEGVEVRRLWHPKTRIPSSDTPTMAFVKQRFGYRLVIDTDSGRVDTDFWFTKTALSRRLQQPTNLQTISVPSAVGEVETSGR